MGIQLKEVMVMNIQSSTNLTYEEEGAQKLLRFKNIVLLLMFFFISSNTCSQE